MNIFSLKNKAKNVKRKGEHNKKCEHNRKYVHDCIDTYICVYIQFSFQSQT